MRLTISIMVAVAAILAACADSGDNKTPTAQPTLAGSSPTVPGLTPIPTTSTPASQKTPTAAATAAAETPVASGTLEVTGIVGTVSLSGQAIEIKRLQGANVTRLELGPRTLIRKATGGSAQLRDIKPSDRIIAKGALNDRKDALIVTEITVQDILPGAQPGG